MRHNGSVIDAYNARHNVAELLERHCYKRQGRRYVAPSSEGGLAGVVILDGRCLLSTMPPIHSPMGTRTMRLTYSVSSSTAATPNERRALQRRILA